MGSVSMKFSDLKPGDVMIVHQKISGNTAHSLYLGDGWWIRYNGRVLRYSEPLIERLFSFDEMNSLWAEIV